MTQRGSISFEHILKFSLVSLELSKLIQRNPNINLNLLSSSNNNDLPIHIDDHDDETDESISDVRTSIRSGDHCMLKTALRLLPRDIQHMKLTLRYAIRTKDSRMLELVYDHWAGVGHCNSTVPAQYLMQLQHLGTAFEQAQNTVNFDFQQDLQLITDIYCLRQFNSSQIELYSSLHNVPPARNEDDRLRVLKSLLLVAIDLYLEHSKESVRASKHLPLDEYVLDPLLKDNSSNYMKYLSYHMNEIYYRKLDFNIATLILNNVHSLKLRLELDDDSYQKIECALYYFIYRVDEDWRLYVEENRLKRKESLSFYNDEVDDVNVYHDPQRLISGPVIYFEWIKFREAVQSFREAITSAQIIRQMGVTLPPNEMNSLTLEPRMRDDFSLKKMIKYLEKCKRVAAQENGVLIIQRTVQVVGEYLKNTEETLHLAPSTAAVINAHIPPNITRYLHRLRVMFSKVRQGYLLHKIELENTNQGVFNEVKKDLEHLQEALTQVHKLYKPIVEKTLLQNGLKLINNRLNELPIPVTQYRQLIIDTFAGVNNIFEFTVKEKQFIENHWSPLNLSEHLFRETYLLIDNEEKLKKETNEREKNCIHEAINNLPTYIDHISKILDEIEKQINTWNSIKTDMNSLPPQTIVVGDIPDIKCKNKIKKKLINRYRRSHASVTAVIQDKLDSIVYDFTVQWKTILDLLQFILEEVNIFKNDADIIESRNRLSDIKNGCHNRQGIMNVRLLLDFIKQEAESYCNNNMLPFPALINPYGYNGIEQLAKLMSTCVFITQKEEEHLRQTFKCTCLGSCSHEELVEKVKRGDEITRTEEIELTQHVQMDAKCRRILQNIVKGGKRQELALQCLTNRAEILKDIKDKLGNNIEHEYRQNEGLRLLLEALLADVTLVDYERKLNLESDLETGHFLAEKPLRHIFAHGHPLLEIIGAKLDPTDSPATRLALAARLAEDAPALVALCELHSQGVRRDQAGQVYTGPHSPRLRNYFKLLPQ